MAKKQPGGRKNGVLHIPGRLVAPIGEFLHNQLSILEKRKKDFDRDDPFVSGRSESLASPDMAAADQFGHARIEAVKKELDRKSIQMRKALARIKVGQYGICEDCGQMIDTDRLMVFPEATLCISCENKKERKR